MGITIRLCVLAVSLWLGLLPHAWAAPDLVADAATLRALDSCMRANIPQTLQVKQLTLSTRDASGPGRTLKGRLFVRRENGLLRAMLKLESPPDLRGAAYLLREAQGEADAMYVFLPALNKTRRIMGGSQHNRLFGTDISYSEIKQITLAFTTGKVALESPQKIEGRPVHVVLATPGASEESPYSAVRGWIDVKTCVLMKAEFISGKDTRKRYSASAADLKQSGSHWYAAKSAMEDLVSHSHTELLVDGLLSDDGLSDNYFNPRSFQLSH